MAIQETYPSFEDLMLEHEHSWSHLYHVLRSPVARFVYMYAPSSWSGQEQDIIDDVLQETVIRLHRHTLLVASGSASFIHSTESFCQTVARNYCRDLYRKERRLFRFSLDTAAFETEISPAAEDPMESILDALTTQTVMAKAASLIVSFPRKQRLALLIDLSRYTSFGEEVSMVEQALAAFGIQLQEYQSLLPTTALERTRHSSLVSVAYKRLKRAFHEYDDIVA